MKAPGIEEMVETFSECSGWLSTYPARDEIRAGLLAVFETHVKGMLITAYCEGSIPYGGLDQGQVGGTVTAAEAYAETAIAQLKEPRHD